MANEWFAPQQIKVILMPWKALIYFGLDEVFNPSPNWPSKPLPHEYTSPKSVKAKEWYSPQVTWVTKRLANDGINFGRGKNDVPP